MFNLTGKIAVVTGASSGLGVQMATAFARQGADLVILARRLDRLETLAEKLSKDYKIKVLPIKCDVTITEEINQAAAQAEQEFGRVDILLNCAGSSKDQGVLDMTDEEWDFTIATDETSVFKMTRAFANIMKKHKYGRIINIASMYGLVGNTEIHTVAYHTSKGAVVNFTRAVAAELATSGITCNCICPGYVVTPLNEEFFIDADGNETDLYRHQAKATSLRRLGTIEEIAGPVLAMCSDSFGYMTGTYILCDGGQSIPAE